MHWGSESQAFSLGQLLLLPSHRGDVNLCSSGAGVVTHILVKTKACIAITGMELDSMLDVLALASTADHCAAAAISLLLIHLLVLSFIF